MYGFIYLTTNLINGKQYIGMCTYSNKKYQAYLGSGKLLLEDIKKYGRNNFSRMIIEECSNRVSLSSAERKWIKFYNAQTSDSFYNINPGGLGGDPLAAKKYWSRLTLEEKLIRNSNVSRACKGRKAHNRGIPHSEETKRKIGLKSVDRNWSKGPEHGKPGGLNPKAKKCEVKDDAGVYIFDCVKDYAIFKHLNYNSLKTFCKIKCFEQRSYKLSKSRNFNFIEYIKFIGE